MFKSDTTKKIAENTIYQMIGKIISMSITIMAVLIITRIYGREGYGEFSLMQSWPALFFIIVDFGINAIAAKDLSKDWSLAPKYFGNLILLRLFFALFIIVPLSIALIFFPYSEGLKIGIALSLFLLITQALYTTTNVFFQVKLRYDLSTLGYLFGYVLNFFLILIFSYFKAPIMWISFTYVIGGFITFLKSYEFIVKKLEVKPDFTIDTKLWKNLFIAALPLGLMFIFSQISFKEDAIMLSLLPLPAKYNLNATETVAVYALPYKVFEVALVVPTFFMNAVYPVMLNKMHEGKEKLKDIFVKSLGFLILSGVMVGFLGYFTAPIIVKFLGGEGFDQSIWVLRVLVGFIVLYYLTSPLSWMVVTLNQQGRLPKVYLISALFNFVCNFIFIPKYSFYGAAIVTQLSEFIILIILIFEVFRAWRINYAEK